MDPSPLGRINGPGIWQMLGGIAYSPTCGPTGHGCASGSVNPGPGGTGIQTAYTAAFDLDQWSGWAAQNDGTGYYFNDYGQKFFVYRQVYRHNVGHLDETASNSYNSIGNYNAKTFRAWALNNSSLAYPDIYEPSGNQRFEVEGITTNGVTQTADYPSNGGTMNYGQLTTNAVTASENQQNVWYPEELLFKSNSDNDTPDANFMWMVPKIIGPFQLGSFYNFPVTTYATMARQFLNNGNAQMINGYARGTIKRIFPIHYIIGGTSNRSNMPAGTWLNYAMVYVDDSFCRIIVQDSPIYTGATNREIQIPATWSAGSITMTLRKGQFTSLSGKYLFIFDNDNNSYLVGQFN